MSGGAEQDNAPMAAIVLPQPGVLALGTPVQAYLEFDLAAPRPELPAVLDALRELVAGVTTGQGCNVVVGVRPSLWRAISPDACPVGVHDFEADVVGDDGFTMPATQHDLVVWVQAGRPDAAFDEGRRVVEVLRPVAVLALEHRGWNYHGNIDLTGFVDGTENPAVAEASEVCLVPEGPGAGSSVLLLQAWRHDFAAWDAAGVAAQEAAIGRNKATDEELDPKPASAHNARTDQESVGKILRKNVPIGGIADPGTLFVGLVAQQSILHEMLERMAGIDGEPRDALTLYTAATSGSYYVLPAERDLAS